MKRYWDKIEIGDALAHSVRDAISRLQIAHFAAASEEFNPLNLDEEQAKAAGFNTVYVPGLMALGFVEDALRLFASNMKIVSLSTTFQRLIWPGDRLVVKGFLVRRYVQEQEYRAEFSLWCENQLKEVILRGSSTCLLFRNVEHEAKSQAIIPQISQSSHDALLAKCAHLVKNNNELIVKVPSEQKEMV
jgi:acyl dehydratase